MEKTSFNPDDFHQTLNAVIGRSPDIKRYEPKDKTFLFRYNSRTDQATKFLTEKIIDLNKILETLDIDHSRSSCAIAKTSPGDAMPGTILQIIITTS